MPDFTHDDEKYMLRAIDLALRGEGLVSPNPMVGCVLIKDGAVIAEGWHEGPGRPHAEVMALDNARGGARNATAYVTLEPCNHSGRTPPCTEALIAAGVAEIVYALEDPNPIASGGARRLEENGVKARTGVCEAAARDLIRFWLHSISATRPYIIAKFAMSLDGKIATNSGESQWITGSQARKRGHDLRNAVDAIIVGAETVIADDPSLTARPNGREGANPLRIVLDSTGRTLPGAKLFDRTAPGSIIATTKAASMTRLESYRALGVETLVARSTHDDRPDLEELLSTLHKRRIQSILIEGGGETHGSFFDAALVDEVWAFIAPIIIGGDAKTPVGGAGIFPLADALRLIDPQIERLGTDILMRGKINCRETV